MFWCLQNPWTFGMVPVDLIILSWPSLTVPKLSGSESVLFLLQSGRHLGMRTLAWMGTVLIEKVAMPVSHTEFWYTLGIARVWQSSRGSLTTQGRKSNAHKSISALFWAIMRQVENLSQRLTSVMLRCAPCLLLQASSLETCRELCQFN